MNTQLQLIGALILSGLFMIGLTNFAADRQDANIESANTAIAQRSMADISTLILYDFRKVGYDVDENVILECKNHHFTFRADIDNNGTVDTLRYWIGKDVGYTPNPNDRLLHRSHNGVESATDMGLVDLAFVYLDKDGDATTDKNLIRTIGVWLDVESRFPVNNEYQVNNCNFKITPKNI